MCEAGGNGVRNVVVPGHGEHGGAQAPEELRSAHELRLSPTVAEVARREHQLGCEISRELAQCRSGIERLVPSEMEVRDVENPRGHGRGRLYTRNVANEAPELFDDIYLGLRAGGAARKQRRGERLSAEEAEAIGRWQRLSVWRKLIAVGAFAVGTFGLGFTIGGLIFGRWRRA